MTKEYEEAKKRLKKYQQEQLLRYYDQLSEEKKAKLLKQILEIDFEQMVKLYNDAQKPLEVKEAFIESMEYVEKEKLTKEQKAHFVAIGEQILKQGQFAFGTMAGGQRY